MILAADIIDQAEKAAHLSDKGLFVLVIVLMGGVIAFLFRDAKQTAERVAADHTTAMEKLITTVDNRAKETNMERERRFELMLAVVKENTTSNVNMSGAIEANTTAIRTFQETLNRLSQALTIERKIP
jgi:hypothetical protein